MRRRSFSFQTTNSTRISNSIHSSSPPREAWRDLVAYTVSCRNSPARTIFDHAQSNVEAAISVSCVKSVIMLGEVTQDAPGSSTPSTVGGSWQEVHKMILRLAEELDLRPASLLMVLTSRNMEWSFKTSMNATRMLSVLSPIPPKCSLHDPYLCRLQSLVVSSAKGFKGARNCSRDEAIPPVAEHSQQVRRRTSVF